MTTLFALLLYAAGACAWLAFSAQVTRQHTKRPLNDFQKAAAVAWPVWVLLLLIDDGWPWDWRV